MGLLGLNLDLPPMSRVVAERAAQATRLRRRKMQRAFEAAQAGRLLGDWTTTPTSANWELRTGLRAMRARSRDLARNDPYVKKFFGMAVSNVVGPKGITLQVRPAAGGSSSATDVRLARTIERKFAEWAHKETASASGKLSWSALQRLAVRCQARDGEYLFREIAAANPFGYALQQLDPNWLDESYNDLLPNGNRVIMSVEVDAFERPVAYYLTPPHYDTFPGSVAQGGRERMRVPAAEIIHGFMVTEGEAQARGVPWPHAVMKRLYNLGRYDEAHVIAARIAACQGGFLKPPAEDPEAGVPSDPDAAEPGEPHFDMEPGMFPVLPAGWDVKEFNPEYPNANYDGFEGAMTRGIAAGFEVCHFSLTGDMTKVNYSSGRLGRHEERDVWRTLQDELAEGLCRRVFQSWLRASMLSGALPITTAEYGRVKEANWKPRGWASIDPLKEITAAAFAIHNGLGTYGDYYGEQGEDFEEKVEQLAREQALLKEKGIVLNTQGLGEMAKLAAQAEDDAGVNKGSD